VKPSGSGERVSVAIAGAGIIGLSIAWRLSQAQYRVAVFDQGIAGGEASWAGAGMLAPGGEVDAPGRMSQLAIESRVAYPQFVRELERASNLAIDYQECGGLDLAYSSQELAALEQRAQLQGAIGIRSKRITAGQALTFWPRLRSIGLEGARFYPEDAIVNPRELTHALKQVCLRSWVSVSEHLKIKELRISEQGVRVFSDLGSQIFDAVVVAAGAWSSEIEVSGVPTLPRAEPVKGQLIGYQQPEQTCLTIIRHGHTYLLQRGNGLLIAGSSMERVGFDREIDPSIEAEIAARAGFVLPHLSDTSPSESWMGFRPASDDLHIGQWHSPRLYLAYGHFRNGILLASATASRLVAEISASWQTQ
jgi:glycine oxidase